MAGVSVAGVSFAGVSLAGVSVEGVSLEGVSLDDFCASLLFKADILLEETAISLLDVVLLLFLF